LPFWYRLTRVVLDKGPLNVRACVRVCLPLALGLQQRSSAKQQHVTAAVDRLDRQMDTVLLCRRSLLELGSVNKGRMSLSFKISQ